MSRYTYVISDIHGQYDALMKMLELINFGYDDELYILGDVIDRGEKSLECIRWILDNDNVLTLLGNHELIFYDNYVHKAPAFYHTLTQARKNLSETEMKEVVEWIENLPESKLIKKAGKHFYLNHTQALNPHYFEEELADRLFPDYERYKAYYDMECKDVISIHGHIPTMEMRKWYNQEQSNHIWKNKDGSIIDIDCGAGYPKQGGCLGCLRLDDMKEFYVDL